MRFRRSTIFLAFLIILLPWSGLPLLTKKIFIAVLALGIIVLAYFNRAIRSENLAEKNVFKEESLETKNNL